MSTSEHDFSDVELIWIPMPDGVRLAARAWMPNQSDACPALFEYIPYRRRDLVRTRDEQNHPYFASHGYVCLRVDMRGSGDSEGHMPDMYSQHELDDARHVIEWIAAQPWCNGRVGMFGTSWGGTASLQAAANAPDALCAVIANCATIDRFEDDIHWMGGCALTDTVEWGATLPAILAAPPDRATVGESWWAQWHDRLDNLALPLKHWLQHNERGEYWRHGSVIHQADRLSCPILAIGGWSDRYSNSVMKLVEARPDMIKGIVGPWGHHFPDKGEPGPAMDFQRVSLQWWNRWLKQEGNDVDQWPQLFVWQRQFDAPCDRLFKRDGEWMAINDLSKRTEQCYYLHRSKLLVEPSSNGTLLNLTANRLHGSDAGDTGYFGRVGGLPLDQQSEDERSCVFDSNIFDEPLALCGSPTLSLMFSSTGKVQQIVCRLCDVNPDGESNLITRTVRNLALDKNLDADPDRPVDADKTVLISLPYTVYRVKAGHKLRLSLSRSYWPLVFPHNTEDDLIIDIGQTTLHLPPASKCMHEQAKTQLPMPVERSHLPATVTTVKPGKLVRTGTEVIKDVLHCGWHQHKNETHYHGIDTTLINECKTSYLMHVAGPARPTCEVDYTLTLVRQDGTAHLHSLVTVCLLDTAWKIDAELRVYWNNELVKTKRMNDELPVN